MKHIISTKQFLDKTFLEDLFQKADKLVENDQNNSLKETLNGKVMATVFYEPSTRTRFSFETAMNKLGGKVITTESATEFSSVTKGETLPDTIRIVGGYADVIVLRHPEVGSAQIAADYSPVPVINAGDGSGEHPTQALLDLYTIRREKGKIDGLTIALIGDLLYGRTVHSLIPLFAMFKSIKLYLVAPPQLKVPKEFIEVLEKEGISYEEVEELDSALGADVLYVTRVQKERFRSKEEYDKVKDAYIFDKEVLGKLKSDAIIMHPLPRVNEIAPELDEDPRAAYFRQAKNGMYIRMALLENVFTSDQ
jgi:aspartate carbamoyltransferase catalytic subunit